MTPNEQDERERLTEKLKSLFITPRFWKWIFDYDWQKIADFILARDKAREAGLREEKERDMRSFNEAAKFATDMLSAKEQELTTLREKVKKLESNLIHLGACEVCWTNSFEPLPPEQYNEKINSHHKTKSGETVQCLCCYQHDCLVEKEKELTLLHGSVKELETNLDAIQYVISQELSSERMEEFQLAFNKFKGHQQELALLRKVAEAYLAYDSENLQQALSNWQQAGGKKEGEV